MIPHSDIPSIAARNEQHKAALFTPYDPIVGTGSPVERVRLNLNKAHDKFVNIPYWMANNQYIEGMIECGDVESFCERNRIGLAEMMDALHYLRCKYDFEYWCATCCKVKDKMLGKMVFFILNNGQRKVYKSWADMMFSGQPIRSVVCKARQWGCSTLTEAFLLWIQIFHQENWNSVIVAHKQSASRNIRAISNRMVKFHPSEIAKLTLKNFEGSQLNKYIEERGCVISIGTAMEPDSLRSDDIKMCHFSEVGLYPNTPARTPEDLIQAIISSVPSNLPNTVIVIESTAKGIGNFFYELWQKAGRDEVAYKPVFVAWWELPLYCKSFRNEEERDEFILSMSEPELYRFNIGATLEGLYWYRDKLKELNGNTLLMMNEFPSDADEAFAATQKYAHNPLYLSELSGYCKEPLYRGEIMADAITDKGALENISFVEQPNGELKIWALPDKSQKIRDRYVVAFDIGSRSEGSDPSAISVLDRYWLMEGGCEERVASYEFHCDQDLAAWKAVQIAKFYNDALLVPEINTAVRNSSETDGDHTLTIFDIIKPHYYNIYARTNPQRVKEGKPALLGFHTNRKTKTELVNHYNAVIREGTFIERDSRAIYQAKHYEIKADGSYGNIDGKDEHDDLHMTTMIALKVSAEMDTPKIIPPSQHRLESALDRPRGLAEI